MTIAIYPGTFDPITKGHVDIITRAADLFDEVIVAIGTNHTKKHLFDTQKRMQWCIASLKNISNVRVDVMENLTADFAMSHNAHYLVRGIRTADDVNYELSIASANRQLSDNQLETIFFAARDEYRSLSSTIVREIIVMKGDVSAFVPACVSHEIKYGA